MSLMEEAIIILLCVLCIWLFFKDRKSTRISQRIEARLRELEKINVLLQSEHLKFQLQPHTLNNILYRLKILAGKLHQGMDSLSEILDYIIYQGKDNFVNVEEEVDFIKKYIVLGDQFISGIEAISFDSRQILPTSKYYYAKCIPHLITAYFIENAFKHGDTNHPDFLKITAALDDNKFELRVVNKYKPKTRATEGIGLKNMKERLNTLMPGKYELMTECTGDEYISYLKLTF